jgi:hypothetical protein
MKLQLTAIVLTAGLSVLLGSSTLSAQDQKAVANIPFAYHVGEKTFSPGRYAVAKSTLPGFFALRETDTGHDTFIPVLPHNTGDKEAWNLTFSCDAKDCSLSQIRMANDSYNVNAKPPIRPGKVVAMISVPLR